ncbi:TPA: EAL domain-containing protein [Kluyvera georgiana]|uniref:EAL domain-containing protein n=1 Tax=Kluyvera georgiana TaxID=73098 RepID=UPI000806F5B9|nr:EAL domain-containing protein [Kluyvera georgiana]MDA8494691.1 EAL domain-containing protein [Kluyvera georgiana]HDG1689661.1 EAL domain-containing protein [Kluyvera georgiana]HED1421209.1 EAL domain-containing protein [Kluyvera georgiana]
MLTGYKFESIRVLHNERIVAWEVLSTAAAPINLEHFFSNLALDARVEIFFAQLVHVIQTTVSGKYYLNASADVMLAPHFLPRLEEQVAAPDRIAVELTDLDQLMLLTPTESQQLRDRINAVRDMGIAVWADDVHDDVLPCLVEQDYYFSGAKIDKHAFWTARQCKEPFLKLAHCCQKIADEVLVEGIETLADYQLACDSHANYGQGFLWNK